MGRPSGPFFWDHLTRVTTAATAISSFRQFGHFSLHRDQCIYITMAERKEFDLFAYIFNREGETEEPSTEDKHVPLVESTLDSGEDDAGNPTPAVIQPQRRQPRKTQPGHLQEPATDSEDSSEDEASSSSRGRAVKTGARSRRRKENVETSSFPRRRPVKMGARSRGRNSNVYSFESITFSQLEQNDREGAQRVLDLYRDERQHGYVHICSRFMSGKCRFMSKSSTDVFRHMKFHHMNEKHPGYKITECPGFKDRKISEFVTKPYAELKQTDPQLAEEALALYKRPKIRRNKTSTCVVISSKASVTIYPLVLAT